MTTDVNPFRDETTHAQFQLMKNYNFNKTRVHLRFIVEPEQLTLPENQGSPPVYSGVHVTTQWPKENGQTMIYKTYT
jgi:hypothetical protein